MNSIRQKLMLIVLLAVSFCKPAADDIGRDIAAIERKGDILDLSGLGIERLDQITKKRERDEKVKELNLANNELPNNLDIFKLAFKILVLYPNVKKIYVGGNPLASQNRELRKAFSRRPSIEFEISVPASSRTPGEYIKGD